MMELFSDPNIWLTLLLLTWLEIVLGIDNIVFIILVTNRLPHHLQKLARRLGLFLAMLMRLLMLSGIVWLTQLTRPLWSISTFSISARDMVMLIGGLFLIVKSIQELRQHSRRQDEKRLKFHASSFMLVIGQIILLDIIFSLDSILTAIAIAKYYWVMATAIIIAVLMMLFASEWLSRTINRHPKLKLLALWFILLVGIHLLLDSLHVIIPQWVLYVSMLIVALMIFTPKKLGS